jgi:hypothetical protein
MRACSPSLCRKVVALASGKNQRMDVDVNQIARLTGIPLRERRSASPKAMR